VADDVRSALLADLMGRVAGRFPRRETRQCCSQMVCGLLMELEDRNCWTIAEAAGHGGPHRLQQVTRHYDWAMLEVTSDDTPGRHAAGHSVLLVRRHRYAGTLSYYRCWTPGPVPLSNLIAVASARWRIEEDHQLS
jgi:hypothetical protein